MAVVIETTIGDFTVDLYLDERPQTCKNFLKLCKLKYYNFSLFHTIQANFIAQTGDPSGTGSGGESVFGIVHGAESRFFEAEKMPKLKHSKAGLISMVNCGDNMLGSQFFITLGSELQSLDEHCVFGEVSEGHEVLLKLNEAICDFSHRPYQDIRITHTIILHDPYEDLSGMVIPDASPDISLLPSSNGRLGADEAIDDESGLTAAEIEEVRADQEAKARATILEIVGDLPHAEIAPPENVLFVCKLNPVTTDEDLEIIFGRFGKINSCEVIRDHVSGESLQYAFIEFDEKRSCEQAYLKMDNVLIDDRRIHVDFSQSVSKIRWKGKGRGVELVEPKTEEGNPKPDGRYTVNRSNRENYRDHRERDRRDDRKRGLPDDRRRRRDEDEWRYRDERRKDDDRRKDDERRKEDDRRREDERKREEERRRDEERRKVRGRPEESKKEKDEKNSQRALQCRSGPDEKQRKSRHHLHHRHHSDRSQDGVDSHFVLTPIHVKNNNEHAELPRLFENGAELSKSASSPAISSSPAHSNSSQKFLMKNNRPQMLDHNLPSQVEAKVKKRKVKKRKRHSSSSSSISDESSSSTTVSSSSSSEDSRRKKKRILTKKYYNHKGKLIKVVKKQHDETESSSSSSSSSDSNKKRRHKKFKKKMKTKKIIKVIKKTSDDEDDSESDSSSSDKKSKSQKKKKHKSNKKSKKRKSSESSSENESDEVPEKKKSKTRSSKSEHGIALK